jgi:hypothetical protein
VAAIGTSSFIIPGGFGEPFRCGSGLDFLNLSLEASGAVLLGLRLGQVPLDRTDLLLLSFANMEEVLVRQGSSSLADVTNALRFAVDSACRAGCLPILVQLPHRRFLDAAPTATGMTAVFAEAGLPVLDVRQIVRKAASAAGIPSERLFRDDTHLKTPIACGIGALLVEQLRSLHPARPAPLRETSASYFPVRFQAAAPFAPPGALIFSRVSPLLAATGVLIRAGMEIEIPYFDEPTSIVGVVVNSLCSRGQLAGPDGTRLNFSLPNMPFSCDGTAFFTVVRPLPPIPIPPGVGVSAQRHAILPEMAGLRRSSYAASSSARIGSRGEWPRRRCQRSGAISQRTSTREAFDVSRCWPRRTGEGGGPE